MNIDITAIAINVGAMILYALIIFGIIVILKKWWGKRTEVK
jgi:hypothetical protein